MRYCSAIIALLAVVTVPATARSQDDTKGKLDKESPIRVLTEYATAIRNYDAQTLERLFDKDYVEISPVGEVDDREKTIGYYRIPAGQHPRVPDSIVLSEAQTRFLTGDNVVVIAKETILMTVGSEKVTRSFRGTFVLRRAKGTWRIFSAHFTALPLPGKKVSLSNHRFERTVWFAWDFLRGHEALS